MREGAHEQPILAWGQCGEDESAKTAADEQQAAANAPGDLEGALGVADKKKSAASGGGAMRGAMGR